MRYCSKCGAMNDTDANFCQGCGAKFSTAPNEEIKTDYTTPIQEAPNQDQYVYQSMGTNSQSNVYNTGNPLINEYHAAAKNRAIAGMILGICAIVFSSVFFIGLPCGIIGIILSVRALKEINSGMANAGKVCSIIGIVFSVLMILFFILCLILAFEMGNADNYYSHYYNDNYWDIYDGFMDDFGGYNSEYYGAYPSEIFDALF